jgi:hypothetical protein
MQALIEQLASQLQTDFNGKSVGAGGDYGATLTRGPYDIYTYFHQWEDIKYPSISVQIVSEVFQGEMLECCGGGVMALTVDFRISVSSKEHGWSICKSLEEALREWLCYVSGDDTLTAASYSYIPTIEIPTSYHIYEGEVFSIHVVARVHYLRVEKGEFTP